jgi:hypothetical protein
VTDPDAVLHRIDRALAAAEYDIAPSNIDAYLNAGMYLWQLPVIHNAAPEHTDAAVRLLAEAKQRMDCTEGNQQ